MVMKEQELVSAALALPAASRVMLIKTLTDSLLDDAKAYESAWFQKAEARASAYERGDIEALPGEEVIRDLRNRAHG